jgi:rhamnosyltransferase
MVNHTCYGPLFPFSELFGEMEKRDCDFWGVTAHKEMTPNPFTGTGVLPYHLNANFIVVRSTLLRSIAFRSYWDALQPARDYTSAVLGHEAFFTKTFSDLGYKSECYIDANNYSSHYPLVLDVDETIIDRNPLLKRRSFFHDPRFFEANAADLPRALRLIAEKSDYDPELIWRNIVRSSELRMLTTNAALTSIIPDVRMRTGEVDYGNVAVCAHVYYVEMLDELLRHSNTIPVDYDFIATTETEEKKEKIEARLRKEKGIKNIIVRVVEQNRGRDMSSLFITCRDLFLDSRYDFVCRLHTKKSPQVSAARGNHFKRHMLENLLNSPGFTTNVLDMFVEKPWIGVAVPPIVQISYGTLGHAWYANREKSAWVRELLDIKVQPDPYTPIAAYGTMFWFRPKALRKLFAHKWKWEDFNVEPNHVDGGLAHALERTICYAAQDAGYTTEQILSSHLASWNFGMLEYKLQRLSAAFPNADFNHQCFILEQRTAAGSPAIDVIDAAPVQIVVEPAPPVDPPKLRAASSIMLLAVKRSIAFRHPRLYKMLRPVYRIAARRKKDLRAIH